MNARDWAVAAASLCCSLVCCNSNTDPAGFGPGSASDCVKYVGWTTTTSSCKACLRDQCTGAFQVADTVCENQPSVLCSKTSPAKDAGSSGTGGSGGAKDAGASGKAGGAGSSSAADANTFCQCMVSQPEGCGDALSLAYSCAVSRCVTACSSGAGGTGGSGAGGKAGSAGKAGSGGAGP